MIFPKLVQHFQKINLDLQLSSMKLDRKNIAADLASQQVDFVIDLEQSISEKFSLNDWYRMNSWSVHNEQK